MSSLGINLYNWNNELGFYDPSYSDRKTLIVSGLESTLSIYYNIEFCSNSKEIVISIKYIGNGEFSRSDRVYVLKVFNIIKDKIEEILDISIENNLFMNYVFNKVERGRSRTLCKMFIKIKDLLKFV